MKKRTALSYYAFFTTLIFIFSCQDIKVNEPIVSTNDNSISISEVKKIIDLKGLHSKNPIWELAEKINNKNVTYIHVPVTLNTNLTPAIPDSKGYVDENIKRLTQSELTHLFFYKNKEGIIKTEVLTYIPEDSYYLKLSSDTKGKGSYKIFRVRNY